MHLIMLLTALVLAWCLRSTDSETTGCWRERWQRTLKQFLLPPLLLLTTAIAIIWMGPHGQMVWRWEGWFSYGLALGFWVWTIVIGLKLAWESWCLYQWVRGQPTTVLNGLTARLLDLPTLDIAQIGFWQPELVISRPLLTVLDEPHLEAVLLHEQAHHYYRDTFWFFWLGWLRRLASGLPQTGRLWQELLILREIRADRWAAQRTDNLLLAEALLVVVSHPSALTEDYCAAFSRVVPPLTGAAPRKDRLNQRIEALLTEPELSNDVGCWSWIWLGLPLLPLLAIPFHQG